MAPINGTIKRLISDKGFGFVMADDGTEYFFHQSACAGARFEDLREGQALTFAQIEDLIGCPLPTSAHAEAAWWANTDSAGAPSAQSSAWVTADRVATANLSARTVSFARV